MREAKAAETFGALIDKGCLLVSDGYRAKNEELGGEGVIFLRSAHVTDTGIDLDGVERFHADLFERLRSKLSATGDVIVTTKGNSTGRVGFVTADLPQFVYSPHLSFWRSLDPEVVWPGYLRYWSMSREFHDQLSGMKASTDMAPYLSLVDQRRLHITLPPPAEQRAVAGVLGALDDKIELNQREDETLEAMARAIFKSWFVDFDPVRAKVDGREPVGMDAETAALLTGSFVDSELGEIPAGWSVETVSGIADTNRDSLNPQEFPEERFALFSIPAFDAGRVPAVVAGSSIQSNKLLVPPNSVLVSKLNPRIPRVWRPGFFSNRGIASTEFVTLTPKPGCPRDVLVAIVSSQPFSERLAELATGTSGSHQRARAEDLLQIPFAFPPPPVATSFSRIVSPMFDRIDANLRETLILATLRDSLLPKLLSGEIRVADAGRMLASREGGLE